MEIHADQNTLFQIIVLHFIWCGEIFIKVRFGLLDYHRCTKLLLKGIEFKHRKIFFPVRPGECWNCGASILGETQNPAGCNPEQPALLGLDWAAPEVLFPSLSNFGIVPFLYITWFCG